MGSVSARTLTNNYISSSMSQDWKAATVLIVDDEELVALELSDLFTELSFKVCGTARTAPEALRQAAE